MCCALYSGRKSSFTNDLFVQKKYLFIDVIFERIANWKRLWKTSLTGSIDESGVCKGWGWGSYKWTYLPSHLSHSLHSVSHYIWKLHLLSHYFWSENVDFPAFTPGHALNLVSHFIWTEEVYLPTFTHVHALPLFVIFPDHIYYR